MISFSELKQRLNLFGQRRVMVASHLLPDGDCLGSAVALSIGLTQNGHIVQNINGEPIPEMYRFLAGNEGFLLPASIEEMPDIAFVLDCSDIDRTGPIVQDILKKCPSIVNIDHHQTNQYFGHYNFVDKTAAATGELIYHLLQSFNWPISVEMATALYTAIATDTGSFQFENTTAYTLQLAGYLKEIGARTDIIRKWLWESKPLAGLLLLKEALNTLQFDAGGSIAWMALNQDIFQKLGATNDLAEGIINYPRTLRGVEISILFREVNEKEVKVGFRSKDFVNVSKLAARFGGGGHQRAAGCTIYDKMGTVIDVVLAFANEALGS